MSEPRDLSEITEGASFTPPAPDSDAWPLRLVLGNLRVYRAVAEGEVSLTLLQPTARHTCARVSVSDAAHARSACHHT